MVSSDRTITDTDTASGVQAILANTEFESFFGADDLGRTWFEKDDLQLTDDTLLKLDASDDADNGFIGIGGHGDVVSRVLGGHLAEICVIFGDIDPLTRKTINPFLELYSAEGDSHTFNVSFGMDKREFHPYRTTGMLKGFYEFNSGVSGESSGEMLADIATFLAAGTPDLASIYAGSNDTTDMVVQAAPAPTDTVFTVDDVSKLAANSWITINGESRFVSSLATNEITLSVALSSAPSASDVANIDTQANIEAWIDAVEADGTDLDKIYVVGAHYLNFTSAGDTTTVEQPLRAAIRVAQQAAATAKGVKYIDTYAFAAAAITAGDYVQGDWADWHQADMNTHLNVAGEQFLADAILDGII